MGFFKTRYKIWIQPTKIRILKVSYIKPNLDLFLNLISYRKCCLKCLTQDGVFIHFSKIIF